VAAATAHRQMYPPQLGGCAAASLSGGVKGRVLLARPLPPSRPAAPR
jgi:hypothetical protein